MAYQPDAQSDNEKRTEIVWAAADLFMKYGYAATSIDAIAEKLGATKGRIYHYYRSKSEIFFDIQRTAMARLFEEVEPLALEKTPAETRLRRMATAHLNLLVREMPMQKVAVQVLERHLFEAEGARHAKNLVEINRLRDDYEQMFAEVLDEGAREGHFSDLRPRLLTKPFFGTLNWVTVWYRPRRLQSDEDIDMIVETLVDFAMRGVRREGAIHENSG
jgi:AcrR family transcriptional regulator